MSLAVDPIPEFNAFAHDLVAIVKGLETTQKFIDVIAKSHKKTKTMSNQDQELNVSATRLLWS